MALRKQFNIKIYGSCENEVFEAFLDSTQHVKFPAGQTSSIEVNGTLFCLTHMKKASSPRSCDAVFLCVSSEDELGKLYKEKSENYPDSKFVVIKSHDCELLTTELPVFLIPSNQNERENILKKFSGVKKQNENLLFSRRKSEDVQPKYEIMRARSPSI